MPEVHLEYIGVTSCETEREYVLRLRCASGEVHDFTVVIGHEVFRSQRARYQDGPDLCFQKMQRACCVH